MPVFELLVEMRLFVGFVEINFSELLNWHVQVVCNLFHICLCDEHSLRPAKPSKCCVRDCIRLCYSATDMNVWNAVAAIDV